MTYSAGSLITAADFNSFVTQLNDVWGNGSGDSGYGQTALSESAGAGNLIQATQWAALVNIIPDIADHQATSITSRDAPVTGNVITILADFTSDIGNVVAQRGYAAESGTEIDSWSGSVAKTTATGSGTTPWTITFTHTIEFGTADAARFFWNAGGIARLRVSKTSTGTLADAEWNDLAGTLMNEIRLVGHVDSTDQVIANTTYTGLNQTVGTGTPTIFLSTTGWYDLTSTDTVIYKQFADTAPYTGQFIQVEAKTANTDTQLVLTTTWSDPGGSAAGSSDNISGGTDTTSPFTSFGTAPATVVTLFPPSTTHLTNTWGTPTITAAVT